MFFAGLALFVVVSLFLALRWMLSWLFRPSPRRVVDPTTLWDYTKLRRLVEKEALPAALVRLDIFDNNTQMFVKQLAERGKKMRLATKSVRVPGLVRRASESHQDTICGLMCFAAEEAAFFAEQGYDDILLGYPVMQSSDFEQVWRVCSDIKQLSLVLMIDDVNHVLQAANYWLARALEALKSEQWVPPLRFCIDVDVSFKPMAGLHLGAHRSSCRTVCDVDKLLDAVVAANRVWTRIWRDGLPAKEGSVREEMEIVSLLTWNEKASWLSAPLVSVVGVMGYEAQVAGVTDANVWTPFLNAGVRILKRLSMADVCKRRKVITEHLYSRGVQLQFVNGGGTGSVLYTREDKSVTEVTVGSGLLQGQLFDYHKTNEAQPAIVFGLRITRSCRRNTFCCQSGGFIASGEISPDKAPVPFLPQGLVDIPVEGFGEVQTPLVVGRHADANARRLNLGDPVFFRPAKSGELAERFSVCLCTDDVQDIVVEKMETYRGLGLTVY